MTQNIITYVGLQITKQNSIIIEDNVIGVNSTAFGRKLMLFRAIPLSRFSLKMSRFFGVFRVGKNALYALFSASSGTQTTLQPASCARQS